MKRRNYLIKGITRNLAEKLDGEFRDDLKLMVNKNGEIEGKISLTIFEALMIKMSMIKFNLTHPCVLKLERCKGKRFAA